MGNRNSDFIDYWMAERRNTLHQNVVRKQKQDERNQARVQREIKRKRKWLLAVMLLLVIAVMFGLAPKAGGSSDDTGVKQEKIPTLIVIAEEPISEKLEQEVSVNVPGEDIVAAEPIPAWLRRDCPMDEELQEALYEACLEFGTYYEVMLSLIDRETDFQNLIGDDGESFGYCQIQPRWWSGLMEEIGVTDLMDPEQNLRCGCAVLASLVSDYGDLEEALTAYNTGSPGKSEYAASVLADAEKWR